MKKRKNNNPQDCDFVKTFKLFFEKSLKDLSLLNPGEVKLLLWFWVKTMNLPQGGLWIPVEYKAVAKELGVSLKSVERYFKRLEELGYIDQFSPGQTIFRIKPELVCNKKSQKRGI